MVTLLPLIRSILFGGFKTHDEAVLVTFSGKPNAVLEDGSVGPMPQLQGLCGNL